MSPPVALISVGTDTVIKTVRAVDGVGSVLFDGVQGVGGNVYLSVMYGLFGVGFRLLTPCVLSCFLNGYQDVYVHRAS